MSSLLMNGYIELFTLVLLCSCVFSQVLERMRRGYTRESYLALVQLIHDIIGPQVALSTDMISGFCGEVSALTAYDTDNPLSYGEVFAVHYCHGVRVGVSFHALLSADATIWCLV